MVDHVLASTSVAGEGGGDLDLRVSSTRVDELRFDIEPPLLLAGRPVLSREYVVFQVTLEDGSTGTAYVLTRGQSIASSAQSLGQSVIGRRLGDLFTLRSGGRDALPQRRAAALLDTCAWDLRGRLLRMPVWQLIGGPRPTQQALLVAGYRRRDETDTAMAQRLVGWRDRGYRLIKIAASTRAEETEGLLNAIRMLAPTDELELVLDLGFAGASVDALKEAAERWAPYGVRWIEDPFATSDADDIAALREVSPIAVAAGDEASSDELDALLGRRAVDVLRADSTTVGGPSGLLDLTAAEIPLSLHIYPEIHRHLAFAAGRDCPVETFPPLDDYDFVDRFITANDDMSVTDGSFITPAAPGFGVEYHASAVSDRIVSSMSFGRDSGTP